jgi:hypothetical protein
VPQGRPIYKGSCKAITQSIVLRIGYALGQETEGDKARAETVGSPGSEQTIINTRTNTSPDKTRATTGYSFNLRGRMDPTPNETQGNE